MNEAGKITLYVFGPLAGIMFTWAAWFVCIGDCVRARTEKRRVRKAEKAQKELEEQQIQEQTKAQTKLQGKLQKKYGNGFEMQPMQSMRV
jgi:hypothetical protein